MKTCHISLCHISISIISLHLKHWQYRYFPVAFIFFISRGLLWYFTIICSIRCNFMRCCHLLFFNKQQMFYKIRKYVWNINFILFCRINYYSELSSQDHHSHLFPLISNLNSYINMIFFLSLLRYNAKKALRTSSCSSIVS